jgi:hypothetical protein
LSLLNSLFQHHPDCPPGANGRTDAAALAIIQINFYLVGMVIPDDTKLGAEESAKVAGETIPQTQTILGGFDGLLLLQTRFKG